MSINKYLRFYIGQKCKNVTTTKPNGEDRFESVQTISYSYLELLENNKLFNFAIIPLLTPLERMTEEHALYCINIIDSPLGDEGFKIIGKEGEDWIYEEIGYEGVESCWSFNRRLCHIDQFIFLLSHGYDIFNLIEQGLAEDIDSLKHFLSQ